MSAKAFALAAALLTTTALSTAANAGGIRVGFGFPLGNFTALPNLSSGPAGTARGRDSYEHCEKPKATARSHHNDDDDAPARKAKRAPKVEVAEEAPAPKKVHRQPKVEVAEQAPVARVIKAKAETEDKPVEIKTAKLETSATASETKTPVSHADPVIFIPEAPVVVPALTGTQSGPAPVRVAALGPVDIGARKPATSAIPVAEPLKSTLAAKPAEEIKPAKAEKTETKTETKKPAVTTQVQKLCRRFSAAVAGLIDMPCGD